VDGEVVGEIGRGLVVFLGVKGDDVDADARMLAQKTANLRIFTDEQEKMNLSIQDVLGSALVISQFTLYAETRKGNRPSFVQAAPPQLAEELYGTYVGVLRRILGDDKVATGTFRAHMDVELVNDGPVTVELRTEKN